jgi:hypothetical protein
LYFAVQKVSTRTPNSWYRAWGVVESGEKGNQGEYRFSCPAVMLLGVHHSENGSFSGCGTKIINHFSGWELLLFIVMRKLIVSSLAVVALGMGGFAANTLLSTKSAQAQPPIIDPGCGNGDCESYCCIVVPATGTAYTAKLKDGGSCTRSGC